MDVVNSWEVISQIRPNIKWRNRLFEMFRRLSKGRFIGFYFSLCQPPFWCSELAIAGFYRFISCSTLSVISQNDIDNITCSLCFRWKISSFISSSFQTKTSCVLAYIILEQLATCVKVTTEILKSLLYWVMIISS